MSALAVTDKYDIIIGLEVHCQLNTASKLFSTAKNEFGCFPNDNTTPVCLGMPGTLPVLNQKAFDLAIKAALAIKAKIAKSTKFDRKHYFYPDLPKGYQISQFDEPYCSGGGVDIDMEDGSVKFVEITRIHMEEDAGKLSHAEDSGIEDSIVDLNRAGTPLLEIVSEPCIYTPDEAFKYLTNLKQILEYIEVSDCNMQEGSLRCDANVSLKPKGRKEFGSKVEIKNMNSFRGVAAALEFELKRQYAMLEKGEKIAQETRLFDPDKGVTRSMRSKEAADDYRYFPEPDLPRYAISDEWVESIRKTMPELPRDRYSRYQKDFGLSEYDAGVLTAQKKVGDYFEQVAAHTTGYKEASNWIMGEVTREMSERKLSIDKFIVPPTQLASLVNVIEKGVISKKIAKESVFPVMLESDESAEAIVERLGLKQESGDEILIPIVQAALAANPSAVADYKAGKQKAIGALVGYCMKETKGKANPGILTPLLIQEINKL